jgi:hypothetical protein
MEDCVLNGELTIDGYKRTIANGMVNSIMDIVEKLKKEVKLKRVRKSLRLKISMVQWLMH